MGVAHSPPENPPQHVPRNSRALSANITPLICSQEIHQHPPTSTPSQTSAPGLRLPVRSKASPESSRTHGTALQPEFNCFLDSSTVQNRLLCLSIHRNLFWALIQQDWCSQEPSNLCVLAFWEDFDRRIQTQSKYSAVCRFSDEFRHPRATPGPTALREAVLNRTGTAVP